MVIIYTSNTGFTQQYATLLGERTGHPVYTLAEGKKTLPKGTEVVYLGWLMAGHISGLDKAGRHFHVVAACGVGMNPSSPAVLDTLAKSNYVGNAPLFYLAGGYAPAQLKGIHRTMLNMVLKGMRRQLAAKASRTEADYAQLDYITKGGSLVEGDQLNGLVTWLEEQGK